MRRSTAILATLLLALVTESARLIGRSAWCLVPAAGAALALVVLVVSVVGNAIKEDV